MSRCQNYLFVENNTKNLEYIWWGDWWVGSFLFPVFILHHCQTICAFLYQFCHLLLHCRGKTQFE